MSEQFPETPVAGAPVTRAPKKKGAPIQRSARQQAAVARHEQAQSLATQRTKAAEDAAQLAQVVNLLISGESFESIGAAIGASAEEVEQMVSTGADRYVRTQPALRTWVRKFISAKYMAMIEADWDIASNPMHPDKLDHQQMVTKMLAQMGRLHGAEAPVQSEVKIEHAAEDVERLVQTLAARQGQGYDVNIFDDNDEDVVDAVIVGEAVHNTAQSSLAALENAARETEKSQPEDGPDEGALHA